MTIVYIIKNQTTFYAKDHSWLDGPHLKKVFYSPHKDVALNTLIEVNSKQPELRLTLQQAELKPEAKQLCLALAATET